MSKAMGVREEISVSDVSLDDDLEVLFSGAENCEFQQMILLLQLNRRLARIESIFPQPKEETEE